jgi:glycosyltransferase involved in cell wall biosynthesis
LKIVYIRNLGGMSGDVTQGALIANKLGALTLSASPLPSEVADIAKIRNYYYPLRSITYALGKLKPDIVFIHTITPQLAMELQRIVQKYITVWRLAVNYEEIFLTPQVRELLVNFWNLLGMMDCIIAPSEHVKKRLNALGYENVVHIPTMVDVSRFKPTSAENNNILSVGRVSLVKNMLTLILAFCKVRREVPTARFLILGDGSMRALLQRIINNMQMLTMRIQDAIHFSGLVKSEGYYPHAKLYVQSSISENGSLTVLEALASGVPCVVSNIGGHFYETSAIEYVNHDDVYGFAEKMIELLTDEKKWKRMHDAALRDVQKYDVKRVVPKYKELFEDLIKLKKFKHD